MDSQFLGLKGIPAIAEPPHSQTNRKMVLEMKKQILSWTLSALLCLLLLPATGSASGITAKPVIGIFQIQEEKAVEYTDDTTFDLSTLPSGTYASFVFRLSNDSETTLKITSAYARIDGGKELGWGQFSLEPHHWTNCHIFYSNMSKVTPGTHKVDFYINGSLLTSASFTLKDSRSSASASAPAAPAGFTPTGRSPYIVFEPEFPNTNSFTQYAVDFIVENQPCGTYLCLCNWDMDLSFTRKQYASVYRQYDGVAAYAGVQVLQDGTRAAIMSVWHTYCKDRKDNITTIVPEVVYQQDTIACQPFSGEGTGIQCIVRYNWKAGVPYRFLLQQSESETTGNCLIAMWICDLSTMTWSKLIEYDLGIRNTYMNRAVAFLEDYLVETAAEYRDVHLSNFRAWNARTGKWVPATSAVLCQNYNHPGSYTWGSDDSSFWCMTTGLPNIWKAPKDYTRYKVRTCETGSPY